MRNFIIIALLGLASAQTPGDYCAQFGLDEPNPASAVCIESLEGLWTQLDQDNSGSCTIEDFRRVMLSADTSGDGLVDRTEFNAWWTRETGMTTRDQEYYWCTLSRAGDDTTDTDNINQGNVDAVFRAMDQDGDNSVSRDEYMGFNQAYMQWARDCGCRDAACKGI
eukprot:GHVU01079082.1.p1 GENE.GHVU01079082.1~~GHVU01079082.1.p1  ORF type:complete len:166 (+),score=7.06 GHVU01079082.1:48-545(+)